MPETITVVVSTFERVDALAAVLRALDRQSDAAFETVVADDGSGPATGQFIAAWNADHARQVAHAWHPHRGFRAGEIRNRAIAASRGDYVVFIDGDCVPHPGFVAAHRALAERGRFVAGNRVLLSRRLTERILIEGLEPESWPWRMWIAHRARGDINRMMPFVSLPLGPLRKIAPSRWRGARTCNLAVWRDDLESVDGFDASFAGWGLEDSDLVIRLLHAGVRRKDGRWATGVLHLWHSPADRGAFADNRRLLGEVIATRRVRAMHGLSELQAARREGASV